MQSQESAEKPQKLVLVKLAAMGDVAMACRALNEFCEQYDARVELHWIIDKGLQPLAQALIKAPKGVGIKWHPIDTQELFRGSRNKKVRQSFSILKTIAKLQPKHVLLLHRDWRYRALVRPVFTGSIIKVGRQRVNELDAYRIAFLRLANLTGFEKRSKAKNSDAAQRPSNKIGLLVGGAKNAKTVFLEKRWPKIEEVLSLLLKETSKEVFLFGGPEDKAVAQTLLQKMQQLGISTQSVRNLVGDTPLAELPARLAEMDSFLSIDSGLAHIAASVMTSSHQKIVTVFGPTDPEVWAPSAKGQAQVKLFYKATECSPCYTNDGEFKPCRYDGERFQHCMKAISGAEVFEALIGSKHS